MYYVATFFLIDILTKALGEQTYCKFILKILEEHLRSCSGLPHPMGYFHFQKKSGGARAPPGPNHPTPMYKSIYKREYYTEKPFTQIVSSKNIPQ